MKLLYGNVIYINPHPSPPRYLLTLYTSQTPHPALPFLPSTLLLSPLLQTRLVPQMPARKKHQLPTILFFHLLNSFRHTRSLPLTLPPNLIHP
ncbi:hypothetical protein HBH79_144810 [Parastagonospora nodorum]|nr:hypothetical protein HBH53_103830 [Parastagonospora nodorum]KAH4311137.1 hypothetical protein HBI01_018130 [Parastagonospora nodorum]KAH4317325.1 hypothetical protein HBI02_034470 [Parastagonospora nodorum]KAH4326557.1 hypothetical protein HBI00_138380 [Parastagonospora nodorum]KAH4388411.1 hypothetical protein HBH94_034350 [Parastagonospora nodorum]